MALRYELLDRALALGVVPDGVLRAGSRWGARSRYLKEARGGVEAQEERLRAMLTRMSTGPIAEATQEANDQHYELPPEFFSLVLGPRRKYSGGLWSEGVSSLEASEAAMLRLTCERAQIGPGQRILDLGCGWGSLSLWLAEHYPESEIVGVSNSHGQREFIEAQARERGFSNLTIHTCDVNEFVPQGTFDRVVSVEMFEHMRNWKELLRRISSWLRPDGVLFVHTFSHRTLPYVFESTWAAERFFTAGLMPSHDLMLHFQDEMRVDERWVVDGTHYARTLQAWLANLDAGRDEALAIFERAGHSRQQAKALFGAWRLFLLSTDEIWKYDHGNSWLVTHYRHSPRPAALPLTNSAPADASPARAG